MPGPIANYSNLLSGPPDFVMVGGPYRSGVRVIASRNLKDYELKAELNFQEIAMRGPVTPDFQKITLTTWLRDAVMIEGPDYPTVMSELMRLWAGQNGQSQSGPFAITAGQASLDEAAGQEEA